MQIDRSSLPEGDRKDIFDEPDFTYVFVFFAASSKYQSLIKYVVRLECFGDCFALKYYCSRCKHSLNKYSRVLNLFNSAETNRIMKTCASVIPWALKRHPEASFIFNGSRTYDRNNYIEGRAETQRYRIYREIVRRLFGENVFYISQHNDVSTCVFVNRKANPDVLAAEESIYKKFASIFVV